MTIKGRLDNHSGRPSNRKILYGVVVVIVLGILFYNVYGSFTKPSYSFSGNDLTISGQYGVKINLSGATVTHEKRQVSATPIHTNGAAIGKIEKGYFKLGSLDVYLNIMDINASDYILINDTNDSKYYINCASPKKTSNLYNEISEHDGFAK